MYRTVLVAVDGSDVASNATRQALAIADALDATVHAVSIVEAPDDATVETVAHSRVESAREYVAEVADEAAARGISAVTVVRAGRPGRELIAYAGDEDMDLFVVGTQGRSRVKRLVTGSVATTVIQDARRPVLTVGREVAVRPAFEDVLVATDGRPGADAAIDQSLALAEAYDATVHALFVVNDADSRLPVVISEFERVGDEATGEVERLAARRGVAARRAIRYGHPHEAIIEYAREEAVDLIVTGTESRSGLDRLAFGSVSQRVVRDAPVPVLTVRAGA